MANPSFSIASAASGGVATTSLSAIITNVEIGDRLVVAHGSGLNAGPVPAQLTYTISDSAGNTYDKPTNLGMFEAGPSQGHVIAWVAYASSASTLLTITVDGSDYAADGAQSIIVLKFRDDTLVLDQIVLNAGAYTPPGVPFPYEGYPHPYINTTGFFTLADSFVVAFQHHNAGEALLEDGTSPNEVTFNDFGRLSCWAYEENGPGFSRVRTKTDVGSQSNNCLLALVFSKPLSGLPTTQFALRGAPGQEHYRPPSAGAGGPEQILPTARPLDISAPYQVLLGDFVAIAVGIPDISSPATITDDHNNTWTPFSESPGFDNRSITQWFITRVTNAPATGTLFRVRLSVPYTTDDTGYQSTALGLVVKRINSTSYRSFPWNDNDVVGSDLTGYTDPATNVNVGNYLLLFAIFENNLTWTELDNWEKQIECDFSYDADTIPPTKIRACAIFDQFVTVAGDVDGRTLVTIASGTPDQSLFSCVMLAVVISTGGWKVYEI